MNTITVYTTTDDVITKMALIEKLSKLQTIESTESLKSHYKRFDVYLTNKNNDRVAFNLEYGTFSLLAIFIGGNLLID